MTKIRTRHAAAVLAAFLLAGTFAGSAAADPGQPGQNPNPPDGHGAGMQEDLSTLSSEWLISDAAEAGVDAAGVTCSYEPAQTAPNPVPASPSFVLLYVYPYDVVPATHLDRPRSCDNGAARPSSIAMSSRNLATFQNAQQAGLNVRTATIAYSNNYGFGSYATRGVRRFKSPTSAAAWANLDTYDRATGSSEKMTRLRGELINAGFDVSNTRYAVVLDASDKAENCRVTTEGTVCGVSGGYAYVAGKYGFTLRSWIDDTGRKYYKRFGCATSGDVIFGHETTHQIGADHVYDHPYDLMTEDSAGDRDYRSGAVWDAYRDDYQATVYGSVYVVRSGLAGSLYTC